MNELLRILIESLRSEVVNAFVFKLLERFSREQIEAFCIGAIFMYIVISIERGILL